MAENAVALSSVSTSQIEPAVKRNYLRDIQLDAAFPDMDPGVEPFGSLVLVQVMLPKDKTKGGIILTEDTKDANQDTTQVAKVISHGPLAFHNRGTGEAWVEGSWAHPGDFVRVRRYVGDRWKRPRGSTERPVEFALVNDLDLLGKVTCDPLSVTSYV